MSRREGPPHASQDGLLYSICGRSAVDNAATEFTATDMCLSTLYLHELHHRRITRRSGSSVKSEHSKLVWDRTQTDSTGLMSVTTDAVGYSQPGYSQPGTSSSSVAAERTPLLAPKKS